MAERTDSERLFQREGAHELAEGPCASIGLDPRDGQSDSSVSVMEEKWQSRSEGKRAVPHE